MDRAWVLSLAVAGAVLACAACSPARHGAETVSSGAAAAARAHPRPVPTADAGAVLERYYQQVEGSHWRFAHLMLSRRMQAAFSEDDLMDRYELFTDLEVTVHPQSGTSALVNLEGASREYPGHRLFRQETLTLRWDGENWTVDALSPRSLTEADTR